MLTVKEITIAAMENTSAMSRGWDSSICNDVMALDEEGIGGGAGGYPLPVKVTHTTNLIKYKDRAR